MPVDSRFSNKAEKYPFVYEFPTHLALITPPKAKLE